MDIMRYLADAGCTALGIGATAITVDILAAYGFAHALEYLAFGLLCAIAAGIIWLRRKYVWD
jgi:hypothetical protein